MTTKVIFIPAGTTWTVPADWNSASNTIEAIGAGGAACAGKASSDAGPGGGSGAYAAIANQTLTPGSTVNIQIGVGGATSAADGTATYLKDNSATTVLSADFGRGGVGLGSVGGAAGLASNCTGTTKTDGAAGGNGPVSSGGGAGAAGPLGPGNAGGAGTNAGAAGGGGGNGGGNAGGVGPAGTGGSGGNNHAGSGGATGSTSNGTPGSNGGGGAGAGSGNIVGGNGSTGTEWTSTAGPTAGSGSGGGGDGAGSGASSPGNGGLYGAGGAGSANTTNFGTGANGIIIVTYTPSTALPPIPPPGYQNTLCTTSTTPSFPELSLMQGSNPAVVSGDYFITPLLTTPSRFPIAVNGDGTVIIGAGGSTTRQSFLYEIWRLASNAVDGPAIVWVNEVAPVWIAGVLNTTPIGVQLSINLSSAAYAQSSEGDTLVFSLASGALPPGVTLTSAGLISGIPTAAGTSNFTIVAKDGTGSVTTSPASSIIVTSGAATGTVPNLIGLTSVAAQAAIIGASFNVGAVTSAASTALQSGFVVSQNPAASSVVVLTTPVSFEIGTGPTIPNPPTVTVPSVVGLTQEQAREVLAQVGLSIGSSGSSYG